MKPFDPHTHPVVACSAAGCPHRPMKSLPFTGLIINDVIRGQTELKQIVHLYDDHRKKKQCFFILPLEKEQNDLKRPTLKVKT